MILFVAHWLKEQVLVNSPKNPRGRFVKVKPLEISTACHGSILELQTQLRVVDGPFDKFHKKVGVFSFSENDHAHDDIEIVISPPISRKCVFSFVELPFIHRSFLFIPEISSFSRKKNCRSLLFVCSSRKEFPRGCNL